MKVKGFGGERLFIVVISLVFGVILAALAVCLWLNRMALFSHCYGVSAIPRFEDLSHNQPVPLRVQANSEFLHGRMEEMVEREDLGLMMLDAESGKRRILWSSGDQEKWRPNEHPQFVVVLGTPPKDPKERIATLVCLDHQGSEYEIYIDPDKNFHLEDWKDVLAKDCNCATLTQKPSE